MNTKMAYLIRWNDGSKYKGSQAQLADSAESAMLAVAQSVAKRLRVPASTIHTASVKRWDVQTRRYYAAILESPGGLL